MRRAKRSNCHSCRLARTEPGFLHLSNIDPNHKMPSVRM